MNGFRFGSSALMVSSSASSARTMSVSKLNFWTVPARIVEDEEPELIEAGRSRRRGPSQVGPSQLAAGRETGDLALRSSDSPPASRSTARSRPAPSSGTRSRPAPLHWRTPGSNLQRVGLSMRPSFTPSMASHASTTARCSSWRLRRRQARGFVLLQRLRDAHRLRRAPGPVETRRAGDDAVEIRREALRFLHRLTSAGGAAVPVRELRRRRRSRRR